MYTYSSNQINLRLARHFQFWTKFSYSQILFTVMWKWACGSFWYMMWPKFQLYQVKSSIGSRNVISVWKWNESLQFVEYFLLWNVRKLRIHTNSNTNQHIWILVQYTIYHSMLHAWCYITAIHWHSNITTTKLQALLPILLQQTLSIAKTIGINKFLCWFL